MIRRLLRSRLFRFLLGLAILLGLVYLIAPLLYIRHRTGAVILVGGLVLIFSAIQWIRGWLRMRQLPAFVARSRKPKGESKVTPPEIQELEREFDRAFQELGRLKPDAISKRGLAEGGLPLLMIVGPPGGGKSTALDQSGLRFTKLGRRVHGVGGTRNCAWWLTEEGIFLDTAGRYSVHNADHDEWLGFLGLLRDRRSERPIDAVILLVALDEIDDLSPPEREQLALEMQARLDELVQVLHVRFPVHLIFSKFDHIPGFVEFFGGLPPQMAREAWGFSVNPQAKNDLSVPSVFEAKLRDMIDGLYGRVTSRFDQMNPSSAQISTLLFPDELEKRLEVLASFTEVVFEPSTHVERPWLSEVYFASATQDGNLLPGARSQTMAQLGAEDGQAGMAASRPTPYFLKGAFSHILARCSMAALPTRAHLRMLRKKLMISTAMAVGVTLVFSFFLMRRFMEDAIWLSTLTASAQSLTQTQLLSSERDMTRVGLLAEFGKQARLRRVLQTREPLLRIKEAHVTGQRLLRNRIDRTWIIPLAPILESRLMRVADWHGDDSGESYAAGYLVLKANFVLNGRECAAADPVDTHAWIVAYIQELWFQHWGAEANRMMMGSVGPDMRDLMGYFFEGNVPSQLAVDHDLVTRAHNALRDQVPSAEVLFQLIVSNAGLSPMDRQLAGTLFEDDGLKRVFTPSGCSKFSGLMNGDQEWWGCILGISDPPLVDREEMYAGKYRAALWQWIRDVRLVKEIKTVADAGAALADLDRPQKSELERLLAVLGGRAMTQSQDLKREAADHLRSETRWPRPVLWFIRLFNRAETKLEDYDLTVDGLCLVSREPFGAYDQALSTEDSAAAIALNAHKESIAVLRDRLQRLHNSVNRNADALLLVRDTMQAKGEFYNFTRSRKDFLDRLENANPPTDTSGMERLLVALEDQLGAVLVPYALRGLQEKWTTGVYTGWRDILSVKNVQEPSQQCNKRKEYLEGTLKQFLTENVASFYQGGNYRQCKPNMIFGHPMPLKTAACWTIARALHTLTTMTCPEPEDEPVGGGSGDDAKSARRLIPLAAEPNSVDCPETIEWAELDTGEDLYRCSISRGHCVKKSSAGRRGTSVVVKLQRSTRPIEVSSAGDIDSLLRKGTTRFNHTEFKLGVPFCPELAVSFSFPPPPAPKGTPPKKKKRIDNRWRHLGLPRSLIE